MMQVMRRFLRYRDKVGYTTRSSFLRNNTSMMKCIRFGFVLGLTAAILYGVLYAQSTPTTPMTVALEARVSTQQKGAIQGRQKVKVSLVGTSVSEGKVVTTWTDTLSNVEFVNGYCSIILGLNSAAPLAPEYFNLIDPEFQLVIGATGLTAKFPVPVSPYAVQARVAEEVSLIQADRIVGTFTATMNVAGNLNVDNGTLYVDSKQHRVGISTKSPQYTLDVQGDVNATGFKLDGKDLKSSLSWVKKDKDLIYIEGNVGVGIVTPQYLLDVAGTVNAREYRINNVEISKYLSRELAWKYSDNGSIYFEGNAGNGNLGIATSQNLTERLNVAGGIKIGKSVQSSPLAGTVEFSDGDFWGYTANGTKVSLTGLKSLGTPAAGNVAVWSGTKTLGSDSSFVWKNGNLGVGISEPTSKLHVKASSGQSPLHIQNKDGKSSLFVDVNGNVGMGTTTPKYPLEVAGVVDAHNYYVDGIPLSESFSEGSFWLKGNNGQLFYDLGNVGIGTTQPANLLELSATSGNAALTFDIHGQDLFTIGVGGDNPDAFIFSKGSDLKKPVFVFNGDKIGVGITNPKANLHVSGNMGFLATGTLDSGVTLPESGAGTRLMWYPNKAAFRAGHVLGNGWDDANIGKFSVAMGYDPKATAESSVVVGGYKNVASGKYSAVLGGFQNEARGDYSFAAGHQAKALHASSFVWSDYVPTADAFVTTAPNQFLIRANSGVGIGTNDTAGSALTVARNYPGHYLMALGNRKTGDDFVVVTTEGGVGVGYTDIGSSKIAIKKGNVGIGTTTPIAALTVSSNAKQGFLFYAASPSVSKNAVVVINASGNVGVGLTDPKAEIDVRYGAILAKKFLAVDPNNPNSVVVLQPTNGSPWADPSDQKNNNNTYRTMGYVGIGTPSPNSLLELSNRGVNKAQPAITFDLNGVDYYTTGIITSNVNASKVFYVVQPGGRLTQSGIKPLVLSTDKVGIGIKLAEPSANLHVSGNTVITKGKLLVGTTNVSSVYDVVVAGTFDVATLNIAGKDFIPTPSPWITVATNSGANIYYPGRVGIATSRPSVALEVNGTISTNRLEVSRRFTLNGELISKQLLLTDQTSANAKGRVYMESGKLKYQYPADTGTIKDLSSPVEKSGSILSGPLAFWVNDSTVGSLPVYWDSAANQLSITSNLGIRGFVQQNSGFAASSNVLFGDKAALSIKTDLSHRGNLSGISGYTGQSVAVAMKKDWGNDSTPIFVKGMDITLTQEAGSKFMNNAAAVGLYVDVNGVNVDAVRGARKAAAVFMGGNVGIGTTYPTTSRAMADGQVLLEVNGVVSANYFNLTGGLDVPQLTVNKAYKGFTASRSGSGEPLVGIGTTDPKYPLEVVGVASANRVIVTNGLTASTVNIGNNAFVVDVSGNVGLGTSRPNGQIELYKSITSAMTDNFTSQKIGIQINAASAPFIFEQQKNLTGLQVSVGSNGASNVLASGATATGVSVNMNSLVMQNGARSVGLNVDVSGTGGSRYAGIFKGGRVGIGTTTPMSELHVSGNIRAQSLYLEGNLQSDRATYNRLVVSNVASMNRVTVNNLTVLGQLNAQRLTIMNDLSVSNATFTTLNVSVASLNGTFRSPTIQTQTLSGRDGYFSNAVAVGGAPMPVKGLAVSGSVLVDSIKASGQLILDTATLNVGAGSLFVGQKGYVGVGTTSPERQLHVAVSNTGLAYDPTNSNSWNSIRLHTKSSVANAASGIVLVPDNSQPSASIGSGIVAVRQSSSASSLVFVTDPSSGAPKERMRITSDGYVGLGTSQPRANLDVSGNMIVTGQITVKGFIFSKELKSTGSGVTLNPNGILTVSGTTSVNAAVSVQKGMYFKPLTTGTAPSGVSAYGRLYVESSKNDLIYVYPSGATRNISRYVSGNVGYIPYVNSNGGLSADAPLVWNSTSSQFVIGQADKLTGVWHSTTVPATAMSSPYFAEKLELTVPDRTGATAGGVLTGMDIIMQSNPATGTNFGRLADGETAVGLRVDLRNLIANYALAGTTYKGQKYAATFLGGNVGIGISAPAAALHIGTELTGIPFRVDVQSLNYALMVASANGRVGIGTSSPQASLDVAASGTGTTPAFRVTNSGSTLIYAQNDGKVGIGTTTPKSLLDINGVVSANTAVFNGGVVLSTLNVGSGALVVDSLGRIGVGTANVLGQFTFDKKLDGSEGTDAYVGHKMQLRVNGTSSTGSGGVSSFELVHDVTGMDISLAGDSVNSLGSVSTPVVARGVSVNLSGITVQNGSKVVGLDVDVTGVGGTRYAALFNGGNVGIGVTNPSEALHVSGDIRARSLKLSGDVMANHITANSLVIQNHLKVNRDVTANRLFANYVSANRVTVLQLIEVSTASFTSVTVNNSATYMKLGIGIAKPVAALEVSGNMTITGNLTVNGILSAKGLQSSQTITMNFTTPGSGFDVMGNVSVNSYLKVGQYVRLNVGQTPESNVPYGQLFVNSAGALHYKRPNDPGSSSIDLLAGFYGQPNRVPFYDGTGNLTSSTNITWDNTTKHLVIGGNNDFTKVSIVSTLNSSVNSAVSAKQIKLVVDNRSGLSASNAEISGLSVHFESKTGTDFGRLANGERAVGLKVDVSNVKAKSTSSYVAGEVYEGYKYSGVFMGGNVGIGTTSPKAGLHIGNSLAGPAFRVDTVGKDYALFVTSNGKVGVGTSQPSAVLDVVGSGGSSAAAFRVRNGNTPVLYARNDGMVGIGTESPKALLDVAGTISANTLVANGAAVLSTLNVGNGAFVVGPSGNISVGTSNARGQFVFNKTLNGSEGTSAYIGHNMNLVVDGASVNPGGGTNSFNLTHDVTGIALNIKSEASNTLGSASKSAVSRGVSINMSDLAITNGSKAIGLDVDVTGTGGTRYAALFKGGPVGIGKEPSSSVALDVSGSIRAKSVRLNGDFIAGSVTVNRLYVASGITLNGRVTVNVLYADRISANRITVMDVLAVSTASFTTVTVNSAASFTRLGVGVANPLATLHVKGSTLFDKQLNVSGTLNVATIYSPTTLNIHAGSGLVIRSNHVTVNSLVEVRNSMRFVTANITSGIANRGILYVNPSGDLAYRYGVAGSELNLSKVFFGNPNTIPYYNSNGNLVSDSRMYWNGTTFQVGTKNVQASYQIVTTTNTSGSMAAQTIRGVIGKRTSGAGTFTGLNVEFASTDYDDDYNFGRLAQGEKAIGINVDVSKLLAQSSTERYESSSVKGLKYAALFLGGNVGIETSDPQAALHIGAANAGSPLRIDAKDLNYAVLVTANGTVGLGTSAPDAQLTVKAKDASTSILSLKNSAGNTALKVHPSGSISIGTDKTPSATVHIVSSTAPFKVGVSSITPNALVVSSNGRVGIGLSNPSAMLHVNGDFKVAVSPTVNALVVKRSNGYVGVQTTTPLFPLSVQGVIHAGDNSLSNSTVFTSAFNTVNDRGFLAQRDGAFGYFGMRKASSSTDAVVMWGTGRQNRLLIDYMSSTSTPVTKNIANFSTTGIGFLTKQNTPNASLQVSGNFYVSKPDTMPAFYVSTTGSVGIGTSRPQFALDVKGDIVADSIQALTDGMRVSNLQLSNSLKVLRSINSVTDPDYFGSSILSTMKSDVDDRDIIGLDIKLDADAVPSLNNERKYTVWDKAVAYGLKVDVSGLELWDPSLGVLGDQTSRKYAAVFLGGPVGIGLDRPIYPLHVQGEYKSILAKFETNVGSLLIRDHDEGRMGLSVVDKTGGGLDTDSEFKNVGLVLAKDKVGIGITNPDKTLVVNGDMRLGTISTTGTTSSGGNYGSRLYFSGAPRLSSTLDSDNGDNLWLGRYNVSDGVTQFRMNFSSDGVPDNDKAIIGYSDPFSNTFKQTLVVNDSGNVGIFNLDGDNNPSSLLHVKGASSGSAAVKSNHLVVLENTSTEASNTLALVHSGLTSGSSITNQSNFVTFINAGQVLGAVEGNDSGGVRYKTNGGDYAEYLEKIDAKEVMQKGDIVGVYNGKISKKTEGAQQLLVLSTAAAVAGNWPGEDKTGYELVAFFGQVKVNVKGTVRKGDYILPSGSGDGVGYAVAPSALKPDDKFKVVGRAWSDSEDQGVKKIHVAVGFGFSLSALQQDMKDIQTMKTTLNSLQTKHDEVKEKFGKLFEEQDKEFEAILKEVNAIKRKQ